MRTSTSFRGQICRSSHDAMRGRGALFRSCFILKASSSSASLILNSSFILLPSAMAARNGSNGAKASAPSRTSRKPSASWLEAVEDRLDRHLHAQAKKNGLRGELARQLLAQGDWFEDEIRSRREAIGGIDNMWLHLSHYEFNPVCVASYTLKEKPSTEAVIDSFWKLTDRFPKYRSKLINTGRRLHGSEFVPDTSFDIRNHVAFKRLPEPAGPDELDNFIAEVEALPWDFKKPLWEATILDNYRDADGAHAAMVMRGHHTCADGQGFVMSQLSVTSFGPELERLLDDASHLIHDAKRGSARPSKLHKSLKPLDKWQKTLPLQLFMFVLFWTFFLLSSLVEAVYSLFQAFYMTAMFLLTAWRSPRATAHHYGPRPAEKEYATSKALPMSDVKLIQKAFSGGAPGSLRQKLQGGPKSHTVFGHLTLNDVLCTCIADVIGAELHRPRPPLPPKAPLHTKLWWKFVDATHYVLPRPVALMIPISIRKPGDWSMRNWSTGAFAYLPNDGQLPKKPDALWKRLHGSRSALSILKRGWLPTLSFWLIQLPTGQIPLLFPSPLWKPFDALGKLVLRLTLTSFTAVSVCDGGECGAALTCLPRSAGPHQRPRPQPRQHQARRFRDHSLGRCAASSGSGYSWYWNHHLRGWSCCDDYRRPCQRLRGRSEATLQGL